MLDVKSITSLEIENVCVHILDMTAITDDDFLSELPQELIVQARQSFKSLKRQREWLGVRLLLKHLVGEVVHIGYESSGAPFLINSDQHISISHSGALVAIALSNDRVGVDVQTICDKPLRLKSHFLSDDEEHLLANELDILTAVKLWCAKEAVYKYLSIPETPLIGGIHLQQKDGKVIEVNHGLTLSFRHYGDAVFAVATKIN